MKRLFLVLTAAWAISEGPAEAGSMALLGVGKVGAAAPPSAPYSIAGAFITSGGGSAPRFTTTADCPVGSVIEVVANVQASVTITGFSDNATTTSNNTFTAGTLQTNATSRLQTFGAVVTTDIPAGASIGPNASGSTTEVHVVADCFPNAIAQDIAADTGGTLNGSSAISWTTGTLGSQPAYVWAYIFTNSTALSVPPSGFTALGASMNGNFGPRTYFKSVTATTPLTITATLAAAGLWFANDRTMTSH